MSNNNNTQFLEDLQQVFDSLVEEGKWEEAREIINKIGDAGFEQEAGYLHRALNRAQDGSHEGLVASYGKEKVEWAEAHVASSDYRDEMDRNYP